jgi:hypothetical protein
MQLHTIKTHFVVVFLRLLFLILFFKNKQEDDNSMNKSVKKALKPAYKLKKTV